MDYYQGYEDAIRQARVTRSTGLMSFLIRAVISILYGAFVYVPLLILGYFLASRMSTLYSDDLYVKMGLVMIIGYLLFSFVYFLKGVMIRARINGRNWWMLVWISCVIMTCGVQAFVCYNLLDNFLGSRQIANYQVWSGIGAGVVTILIYSHYQFLTNIAPRATFWSYQLGFLTIRKNDTSENRIPQKSPSYFDNAPMRVSFKR